MKAKDFYNKEIKRMNPQQRKEFVAVKFVCDILELRKDVRLFITTERVWNFFKKEKDLLVKNGKVSVGRGKIRYRKDYNPIYKKFGQYIKLRQSEANKTKHHCGKIGCMKPVFKVVKRTNRDSDLRFCKTHYNEYIKNETQRQRNKFMELQFLSYERALNYYESNFNEALKSSKLKKKQEVFKLIEEFYETNPNSEPLFRTLIVDILNLQGLSPAAEYPMYFKLDKDLIPPKADIFERKLKIAIECKASFFRSQAQLNLKNQLNEYKKYYNTVISVCPDNYKGLKYKPMALFDFLKYLEKK